MKLTSLKKVHTENLNKNELFLLAFSLYYLKDSLTFKEQLNKFFDSSENLKEIAAETLKILRDFHMGEILFDANKKENNLEKPFLSALANLELEYSHITKDFEEKFESACFRLIYKK